MIKPLIYASALALLMTAPSFAHHQPGHTGGGGSVAVPGPVAGVGIPVLAAYGGYVWIRRRRKAETKN